MDSYLKSRQEHPAPSPLLLLHLVSVVELLLEDLAHL